MSIGADEDRRESSESEGVRAQILGTKGTAIQGIALQPNALRLRTHSNVQARKFTAAGTKPREQPNMTVGGNSTMTKHEESLWELLLHEIETKAELTRMYFDSFTFIANTEQLEEFQLHKKQREESRRKALKESFLEEDEQE